MINSNDDIQALLYFATDNTGAECHWFPPSSYPYFLIKVMAGRMSKRVNVKNVDIETSNACPRVAKGKCLDERGGSYRPIIAIMMKERK